MNQRIFLSSTFQDLYLERGLVRNAAISDGWEFIYFDTVPGLKSSEVLQRVHQYIRSCDVLCILIGSRYGSPAPQLAISYVHFEFALARQLGKKVIALVQDERELSFREREWDSIYPKGQFDLPDLRKEIIAFEKEGDCIRKQYSSRDSADNGLSQSAKMIFRLARKKWIEGEVSEEPQPPSNQAPPGSNGVKERLKNLTGLFTGNSTKDKLEEQVLAELHEKLGQGPSFMERKASNKEKQEFSKYFFDYNLPLLVEQGRMNFFFGGGSTAFFLLNGLQEALKWTKLYGLPRITIHTTNVLIHLQLLLEEQDSNYKIVFTAGKPDPQYGSIQYDKHLEGVLQQGFWQIPEEERGMFLSGVITPTKSNKKNLASNINFRVFISSLVSNKVGGVLFMNLTTQDEQNKLESTLVSVAANLKEPTAIQSPLAVCFGTGSKEGRQLVQDTFENSDFEPISPTYGEAEYQKSFPLLVVNETFRKQYGTLIG